MTDDDFAQHLRARVHELTPHVTVHTSRVLARARHRRAGIRSAQTVGAVGALAVVGASAAGLTGATSLWRSPEPIAPATTSSADATPPVETPPVETPAPAPAPSAIEAPEAPVQGRYWHTVVTYTDSGGSETSESWQSLELPGLVVSDGDLATASAMGPVDVIGRFKIDGQWVDMLRDPHALPTEGAALGEVLRASVEPDRGSGSDDDKVIDMARHLLMRGALVPEPLLRAAWDAAADVPGSTVTVGTDSSGRRGEVFEHKGTQGDVRLVRDPVSGLLLEQGTAGRGGLYTVQEFTDAIPLEPTLEMSGCTAWSSC